MVWLSDHPAYAAPDTPTRVMAGYVKSPDMAATWAPSEHVTAGMYELVARKQPIPIRFPTGAPAWGVVRSEVDGVIAELESIKDLSFSIDDGVINKSGQVLRELF